MNFDENEQKVLNDLINSCAELKITKIEVAFDGSGDSGQVESIDYYLNESDTIEADKLNEIVEDFVYIFLNQKYCGWENNNGAFGTLWFNFEKSNFSCNFYERIITEELTQTFMSFNDCLRQDENSTEGEVK